MDNDYSQAGHIKFLRSVAIGADRQEKENLLRRAYAEEQAAQATEDMWSFAFNSAWNSFVMPEDGEG